MTADPKKKVDTRQLIGLPDMPLTADLPKEAVTDIEPVKEPLQQFISEYLFRTFIKTK